VSKFTAETRKAIIAAVRNGMYFSDAAAIARVHRDTLLQWIKRGDAAQRLAEPEDSELEYLEFVLDLRQAEAEVCQEAVMRIRATDNGGDKWFLDRRFRDRWGSKERVEVSGPNGGAIPIPDSRIALAEAIAKAIAATKQEPNPASPSEPK
jgi:hypothetical protein